MKKMVKILTAAAVVAPVFAQAGMIEAAKGSIENSLEASAQASQNLSTASVDFTRDASGEISEALTLALTTSKDLVVKGAQISEKGATVVIGSAKSASQESAQISRKVITASGKAIEASLDLSRKAIHVSVEVSEDAGKVVLNVMNEAKTALIGSVTLSKEAASKLADSAEYMVDAAGNLIRISADKTSQVVGSVLNESSEAVKFVVDKTGQLLQISANESVMIIHGSADSIKLFAKNAMAASQQAGALSAKVLRASAQGTLTLLQASGRTIRIMSEDLESLFHSERE